MVLGKLKMGLGDTRRGLCHHSDATSLGRGTGIFEDAAMVAKQQILRGEVAELAWTERTLEQLVQDCALQMQQLADNENNQRYPC